MARFGDGHRFGGGKRFGEREPADLIAALIVFLKADSRVAALVGVRVGRELPSEAQGNIQACVVLTAAGGGLFGRAFQPYGDRRIDTHCYGATLHEAEQVHLAVRAALKALRRQVVAHVLIHWARIASDGATGRDPLTQWPLCLASYQVLHTDYIVT